MDITNFIRNGVTYPIGDTKSRESIATAFDSTTSYSTGDYVMYDGTLYKFTSSHSGDWDSTHAEATCVTNELGSGGSGGNAQVMYYYEQPVNTATNAEIFRITSPKINTDTVVLECTFADPSYITSDVTWTSYKGYIAFTGTCTAATTANVTMAYKSDDIITKEPIITKLAWIASSNNGNGTQLTEKATLSIGKYLLICSMPAISTNTSVGIKPETNAITIDSFFYLANHSYDSFSKYFEVNSDNTEVYIGSAQSAGVTFTDISTRAGVIIIKISDTIPTILENKREVLYNANNIVMERTGNIYHYYTTAVVTQSNLNTATSAISAYAPLTDILKCCTYRTSTSSTYVTLLCRLETNGNISIMDNGGSGVSSFAYITFDFIYFK